MEARCSSPDSLFGRDGEPGAGFEIALSRCKFPEADLWALEVQQNADWSARDPLGFANGFDSFLVLFPRSVRGVEAENAARRRGSEYKSVSSESLAGPSVTTIFAFATYHDSVDISPDFTPASPAKMALLERLSV